LHSCDYLRIRGLAMPTSSGRLRRPKPGLTAIRVAWGCFAAWQTTKNDGLPQEGVGTLP
jgi:hypothetical protein